MTDHVVEIQHNDWTNLKKLYTPDGLKNFSIAYMAIENYIRWVEQSPDESEHIKFFCLNGDFSDGTFVITVSFVSFDNKRFYSQQKPFLGSLCRICGHVK